MKTTAMIRIMIMVITSEIIMIIRNESDNPTGGKTWRKKKQ